MSLSVAQVSCKLLTFTCTARAWCVAPCSAGTNGCSLYILQFNSSIVFLSVLVATFALCYVKTIIYGSYIYVYAFSCLSYIFLWLGKLTFKFNTWYDICTFLSLTKKTQTRRATEWAFYRFLQATHDIGTSHYILLCVVQCKHINTVSYSLPSPTNNNNVI